MRRRLNTGELMKRHANLFISLKHDDVCCEVRALLETYSSDVIAAVCEVSKIDPTDMDVFLYANGMLTARQMTSIMSNLNYRQVQVKVQSGELDHLSPERLVQHIEVMQQLNILNNMRANKAEDEAKDGTAESAQ